MHLHPWPSIAPVVPLLPPAPEFAIIREMLDSLETTSTAGQRYVMGKVLGFLGDQVQRTARGTSPGDRRMLAGEVANLRRETDRLSPDVRSFTEGTETLIALLAGSA